VLHAVSDGHNNVYAPLLLPDDSSGLLRGPECGREDGAHHPRREQHPAVLLQQEGVRGASHRVPAARDRPAGTGPVGGVYFLVLVYTQLIPQD